MHPDTIKSLRDRRPFVPFDVRTAGDRYRVAHPEAIDLFPSGGTVLVARGDDGFVLIALPQIEVLSPVGA